MKIDQIELLNADCMDILKQTPDNYYSLAIVDPPYGIKASKMTMGSGKHKFKKDKSWDNEIPNLEYWNELFRISENQIIWGGNYFTEFLPPSPHWLIWDKKNPNLSFAEAELAWVRNGNNCRIFQKYSALIENGGKIHPTQKPVDLYDWILTKYAKNGFKIIDTHLGSGSIAIAIDKANTLDKKNLSFLGIELDKDYYDAACKRFLNYKKQFTLEL